MKITGKSIEVPRTTGVKPTAPVQGNPTDTSAPKAGVTGGASRSDSVQISDAGRALSGPSGSTSLSPERVSELRKRVLEGAYNSTHVVDTVAKRILERGDA